MWEMQKKRKLKLKLKIAKNAELAKSNKKCGCMSENCQRKFLQGLIITEFRLNKQIKSQSDH